MRAHMVYVTKPCPNHWNPKTCGRYMMVVYMCQNVCFLYCVQVVFVYDAKNVLYHEFVIYVCERYVGIWTHKLYTFCRELRVHMVYVMKSCPNRWNLKTCGRYMMVVHMCKNVCFLYCVQVVFVYDAKNVLYQQFVIHFGNMMLVYAHTNDTCFVAKWYPTGYTHQNHRKFNWMSKSAVCIWHVSCMSRNVHVLKFSYRYMPTQDFLILSRTLL